MSTEDSSSPLPVLYRDGLMLVIDKPAGMPVHRGPKGGASLEDDFDALRFGLPRAPALAHRLDRETAGCLVLGRHRKALAKLGLLFKQGKVGKTYWAVVAGGPEADEGLIDKPLGRLDATRGWWMKVDPAGQPSQTRWRVLGRGSLRGQRDHVARNEPADRAHASAARPRRLRGLADPRRSASTAPGMAKRRCNCWRGGWRCRCRPTSRRSWWKRRRQSICARRWRVRVGSVKRRMML